MRPGGKSRSGKEKVRGSRWGAGKLVRNGGTTKGNRWPHIEGNGSSKAETGCQWEKVGVTQRRV